MSKASRLKALKEAWATKLKNRAYAIIEHVGNAKREYPQRVHPDDGEALLQVVRLQRGELPAAYQEMGWQVLKEEKKTSTRSTKKASGDK